MRFPCRVPFFSAAFEMSSMKTSQGQSRSGAAALCMHAKVTLCLPGTVVAFEERTGAAILKYRRCARSLVTAFRCTAPRESFGTMLLSLGVFFFFFFDALSGSILISDQKLSTRSSAPMLVFGRPRMKQLKRSRAIQSLFNQNRNPHPRHRLHL